MSKILNTAQARAIADAMCALNNVNGKIECAIGPIEVWEHKTGEVVVHYQGPGRTRDERYDNQNAFMAAYGVAE